jgi:hypothetical protein
MPRESPARRALVQMMGTVIAVHIAAIVIYRVAGIQRRPEQVGRIFGAVWTLVTLVVVGVGLYRVRVARQAAREERLSRRP